MFNDETRTSALQIRIMVGIETIYRLPDGRLPIGYDL
jgi:hypothetical protein